VVSASTLNTYVEANLAFLGGPYYARAYQSGSVQSIPNTTYTTITLNTIDVDPNSNFNTGTSTYTAPVAGRYLISGAVHLAATSGVIVVALLVNGTIRSVSGEQVTSSQTPMAASTAVLLLNLSDTVTMQCYQNTGGAVNTYLSTATGADVHLSINCLGPQ
jgi:hypothetical protein